MKFSRNLLIGLAGASLAMSPAVAAPADRASQNVEDGSQMAGTGWIFILGAIAVAILAVVAFNNDNDPVSP